MLDQIGPIVNTNLVHYHQDMRTDAQMKIRLPEDVHAEVAQAAKANSRSMNSEILHRLQSSGSSAEDLDTIRSQALHIATYDLEVLLREGEISTLKARLALLARHLEQTAVADDPIVRDVIDEFKNFKAPKSQVEKWNAQVNESVKAMKVAIDRLDEVRPPPPEEDNETT